MPRVAVPCSPARADHLPLGTVGRSRAKPAARRCTGGPRSPSTYHDGLITTCTLRPPSLWKWGHIKIQAAERDDGVEQEPRCRCRWTRPAAQSPTCDQRQPLAGADLFDFNDPILRSHRRRSCTGSSPSCSAPGRPLSEQAYLDGSAGLSDVRIVITWSGANVNIDAIVAEHIQRYIDAGHPGPNGRRGHPPRRACRAASRVPVLIVSGAARAEIEAACWPRRGWTTPRPRSSHPSAVDGRQTPTRRATCAAPVRSTSGIDAAPAQVVAFGRRRRVAVGQGGREGMRRIAVAGDAAARKAGRD